MDSLRGTFAVTVRFGIALTVASALASCGSSSSEGTSVSGLNQLPSAAGLLKSTSSSSISRDAFDGVRLGSDLMSVTGTAPNLVDLSWSETSGGQKHPDKVFWNGLVSTISGQGSASDTQKQQFWGVEVGGPAGQGGCFMTQSVGESVSRILSAGTSACFMKKIPTAASGVTISGASATDLFNRGDSAKIVKVMVQNMIERGESRNMNVFLKVYGTDSAEGSAGYAADLYFCPSGATNPNGLERIRYDQGAGVVTFTNYRNEESEGGTQIGSEVVTAYLKDSSGTLVFDTSKDRSAIAHYQGSWGLFKGKLSISGANQITAYRYNRFSHNDQTNEDFNYSLANFTSTLGLDDLKFTEGAFVGWNKNTGSHDHAYKGQMEFQTDHYVTVTGGVFESQVTTFAGANDAATKTSFQSDDFFKSSNLSLDQTAIAAVINANSCSATPAVTVTMDFSTSGVQAVKADCEGERYDNYNLCWSSQVQTAQQYIW